MQAVARAARAPATRTGALLAVFVIALFFATPHGGALHDGQRYEEMAQHPFANDVGTPWSLRIGIPLLARALPFGIGTAFDVLAVTSAFLAAILVAAIVRRLGLPERHALAGGVLATGTTVTVTSFWTYYVDIHVLAFVAAALYLSQLGRRRLLVVLTAGGVAVKEIVMLVGAIPFLLRGRPLLRTAVVATAAGLAVYGTIDVLVPHGPGSSGGLLRTQLDYTRIWFGQIWRLGLVRYTGNAVLGSFGLTWLLWWKGWKNAPRAWRTALIWIPLTLPLFMTAQWERTFGLYTPLLAPLALLGVPRLRAVSLACLTAASVWVSAGVETLTIGDDRVTSGMHKLLLMSPGFAVAAAMLALATLPRLRQSIEPSGPDGPGGVVAPSDP